MSDRGEYASIPRALAHGPDFQALSERARWVFVVMCLTFNGVGLEIKYPDSLAFDLAAQTGATADEVKAALDQLEQNGWIRREANVIWLCGRLEHSGLTLSNPKKHIPHVRKIVAGLPHLSIVSDFVHKYRAWFVEDPTKPDGNLADGFSWVAASLSIANPRKKTKRASLSIGNRLPTDSYTKPNHTKPIQELSAADASVSSKNWVADGSSIWREKIGDIAEGHFGKALAGCVKTHGWPAVRGALIEYAGTPANGKPRRVEWFAENVVRWIAEANTPLVGEGGVLTAKGQRLAGVGT